MVGYNAEHCEWLSFHNTWYNNHSPWFSHWLTNSLTDSLADWLTDSLTDWLPHSLKIVIRSVDDINTNFYWFLIAIPFQTSHKHFLRYLIAGLISTGSSWTFRNVVRYDIHLLWSFYNFYQCNAFYTRHTVISNIMVNDVGVKQTQTTS